MGIDLNYVVFLPLEILLRCSPITGLLMGDSITSISPKNLLVFPKSLLTLPIHSEGVVVYDRGGVRQMT